MNVAELKAKCEALFNVGQPTSASLSATGEPYDQILSGGMTAEGEIAPAWCSSPEIACKLWWLAFQEYAADKRGKLYWRIEPEMGERRADIGQFTTETRYAVYGRLLISDKPSRAAA